jgi:hypothetical protein
MTLPQSPFNDDSLYNPLHQMIEAVGPHKVSECVCGWSDLLGFGTPFRESNWKLSEEQWTKVANRLQAAYSLHCKRPPMLGDYMLMLNDGVVRTRLVQDDSPLFLLALWMRDIIWTHIDINQLEEGNALPGTRSVVTSGEHAHYAFHEVRVDDLVLNYTRAQSGMSKIGEMTGNPVVISNPAQLQMNTAFSKAFLLDEAGSKAGLKGNRFFIDRSFLDLLEKLVEENRDRYTLLKEEREGLLLWAIVHKNPRNERVWEMGLQFDKASIEVALPSLTTVVYRLLRFYPHDEDPNDFYFELEPSKGVTGNPGSPN